MQIQIVLKWLQPLPSQPHRTDLSQHSNLMTTKLTFLLKQSPQVCSNFGRREPPPRAAGSKCLPSPRLVLAIVPTHSPYKWPTELLSTRAKTFHCRIDTKRQACSAKDHPWVMSAMSGKSGDPKSDNQIDWLREWDNK